MVGRTGPLEISALAARLAEVGVAERALVQIGVSRRCIILSRHGMSPSTIFPSTTYGVPWAR
jgi:hypothetical protein